MISLQTFNNFFMDISFIPAVQAAGSIIDTNSSYNARDIIRVGVSLIVLVAWLCAILFIIWGWLMLILSGGKDEKVKPAINSIRYAVIGIIVIVIAIFVAPKVSQMLGLGDHDYLSPKSIFDMVKILMSRIFGSGDAWISSPSSTDLPADFSSGF
jgi:uncharacterized sodium:solute symporter family permease YidK